MISQEQRSNIVERLQVLDPDTIYLFGSSASGAAVEGESDVDLCVVVPDDGENSYRKAVKAYRSLRDIPFPKDIIVRHRKKFQERASWTSSIEREILQKGLVLYSRNDG